MQEVYVGPSQLRGRIKPPPSKSMAHRVLIAAALAQGCVEDVGKWGLTGELSQDLKATQSCLEELLAPNPDPVLDCGESGSTLRFLLPLAAALGRSALFVGKDSLARRPLREYAEILGPRGVRLEFAGEQNLPVKVGGKLQSGVFQVPGHISSQYITGLMLALPLLEGDSTIVLTTPLQSAPYVEMTQAVLDLFGIVVRPAAAGWVVPGRQKYVLPEELELEADYSQAAFWLAAKSLGHALEVEGLSVKSVQGDREIIPLLEEMGSWKPGEERRIDAAQIPDLVPILAVVALARPGVTILENAQRLRFKESDRLLSTAEMLGSMGAKIAATTDSLLIHGGEQLTGGEVDAHNDHRIAMAAAIAALNSRNGATIMGADAVGKSYPGFFQELQRLGGDVRGI